MRTCAECGVPVHIAWEYCKRCGAELTERVPPAADQRLIPAMAAPRIGLTGSLASGVTRWREWLARPRALANGLRGRMGISRLSLVIPVAVALVIGAGAGTLLAGDSGSEAQAALIDTQAEAEQRRIEAEQLRSDLAAAEAENEALASDLDALREEVEDLEGRLAGGEEVVGDLEEELDALREQLAERQEAIDERDQQLSAQLEAITALRECLSGTEVALAFARDRRSNSTIDRALETVEEYCQRARAVQ